jgi:hypothetical protein
MKAKYSDWRDQKFLLSIERFCVYLKYTRTFTSVHGYQSGGLRMGNWRVGIDSGGTFTDVCMFDETQKQMRVWKVSSMLISSEK